MGGIADSFANFVWEPALVKINAINAATEAACLVLSVDETVKNPKRRGSFSTCEDKGQKGVFLNLKRVAFVPLKAWAKRKAHKLPEEQLDPPLPPPFQRMVWKQQKQAKLDPLTINDLVFGGEPINLEELISSFPGRQIQILEIMRLLGPLNSPMLPLFLYGGTSTGKTSIILQIFRLLNRPFVYSSCLTCYSPPILFESVLNLLLLHRKNADNGYASVKCRERPSDFVVYLREALTYVLNTLKGNSGKSSSRKLAGQANGRMIYLIFDNLDLVREWDKSSSILPFLFELYDILKSLRG